MNPDCDQRAMNPEEARRDAPDRPREKCGVFAISGTPAAAELAFMGLYALQHRGQESAGIVAIDELGTARSHRGMGLVADVFDEDRLAGLLGSTAIGHVRYSTSGDSNPLNAQPFLFQHHRGPIAISHGLSGSSSKSDICRTIPKPDSP